MVTCNLTIPTPSKFVSLFVDLGAYPGISQAEWVYASGLQLNVIEDVFEIYFPFYVNAEQPLFTSQSIIDNYEAIGLDQYFQKVKFLFDLSQFYRLMD